MGQEINEQQNHQQTDEHFLRHLQRTHKAYLEAELKTTSLNLNLLILLVKSIQGEICPSDLLFNFLVDEHSTG
jgi:hypothetical protein